MRDFTASINKKKSDGKVVRGTITVDGIQIPFTVYRKFNIGGIPVESSGYFDSTGTWSTLVLRSKNGILKTFKEGDLIASKVKDKARGWWIDQGYWR